MIFEQMDLCYYSDFVYREQLLRISQQLTAQDIEKLLWLLKKVIPLARAEKISKGYQLFDDLEKQSLLGPNNLNILSNCLSATGREDLVATTADNRAVALFSPLIVAIQLLWSNQQNVCSILPTENSCCTSQTN